MWDRPLIAILLSFVAGLLLGPLFLPQHALSVLVLSLLAIILILVPWILSRKSTLPFVLPGFFLLGTFLILQAYPAPNLLIRAVQGRPVTIEGIVLEPSKQIKDRVRLVLRADRVLLKDREMTVNDRILVNIFREGRTFSPGEKIRFPARLRPFRNFGNPGAYNYELAMRVRGLSCAASVSDGRRIVPMGKGQQGLAGVLLENIRGPVRRLFTQSLAPGDRALYRALVLGERQDISPQIREPFDRGGLGHILAVSGLHIGLIAWLFFTAVTFGLSRSYRLVLGFPLRKVAAVLTCVPVIAYACIAGFQVSSQRAMIMVLAFLLSLVLGREKDVWTTLALAALIILAIHPLALYSISFQLSFFAVTGILCLAPVFYSGMIRVVAATEGKSAVLSRVLGYAAGLFSVTLSATIFLLPLTVFYFNRISLVALPANMLTVPLLGLWVLPLGLMASLTLFISQSAAAFLIQLGALGLEWIREITAVLTRFTWSSIWVISPNGFEVVLIYLFPFFLFLRRRRPWAKAGLGLVLLIMTCDVCYWVYRTRLSPKVRITVLDVGQGNAVFVQLPKGKRMLIDGGGYAGGLFDTGRMVVAPFLLREKIKRLDYLVLTHPQSDHMNGLRFIAAHFHPGEFWSNGDTVATPVYRELMDILSSKKIKNRSPPALENSIAFSGVRIDILHPSAAAKERPGKDGGSLGLNDRSLVLKLTYGGASILFPGDLEQAGEALLVSRAGASLRSDVLIAPHHGSGGACTGALLESVRPRFVIISCGKGNRFGFPHRDTIARIRAVKAEILRTDREGAVEVTIGPNGLLGIRSIQGESK